MDILRTRGQIRAIPEKIRYLQCEILNLLGTIPLWMNIEIKIKDDKPQ